MLWIKCPVASPGDARSYLDDLEVALALLANPSSLYGRLDKRQQNTLLRIPVKRIIINQEDEIISHELHQPFLYLSTLVSQKNRENEEGSGSEFVTFGAQIEPLNDVERFLSMVRFDSRGKLDQLNLEMGAFP